MLTDDKYILAAVVDEAEMSVLYAIKTGDLDRVKQRMATHPEEIDSRDGAGRTCLHQAVWCNELAIAEWLLDNGADIHAKEVSGQTPLHYAVRHNLWNVTVMLLTRGAEIDARMKDGCTPLHLAAIHGFDEIAEFLLSRGADCDAAEYESGKTALHYAIINAVEAGSRIVELLLGQRSQVNTKMKNGKTALHLAASLGHFDIARLLIAHGSDVDARDGRGQTPLHLAVECKNPVRPDRQLPIIGLLVENGADPLARTNEGHTPMELAVRRGNEKLLTALRKKRNG